MHGMDFEALGHPLRGTDKLFSSAWTSSTTAMCQKPESPHPSTLFKVIFSLEWDDFILGHFQRTLELV
jgi:hypothetical protein